MKQIKANLTAAALILATLVVIAGCAIARAKPTSPTKPNTMTKKEIAEGFKLLFDGKTLDNFKGATNDKVLNTAWIVRQGTIYNPRRDQRPETTSGSIVTKKQYGSFDFRFEYKLDPSGGEGHVNSGIKYFAYPKTELGLEYQLYNAEAKVKGPHALADLYDLLPAKGTKANPPGKWNSVRIVAKGSLVQHYHNGIKVLQFERGSEQFRNAVAKSKFKNREKFGEAKQGHILLQDHGGGISFRTVRIKVLED